MLHVYCLLILLSCLQVARGQVGARPFRGLIRSTSFRTLALLNPSYLLYLVPVQCRGPLHSEPWLFITSKLFVSTLPCACSVFSTSQFCVLFSLAVPVIIEGLRTILYYLCQNLEWF